MSSTSRQRLTSQKASRGSWGKRKSLILLKFYRFTIVAV